MVSYIWNRHRHHGSPRPPHFPLRLPPSLVGPTALAAAAAVASSRTNRDLLST